MSSVRQRIMRYYGHIRRHDSIQKTNIEGKIDGKRGRGRKRTNWIGNVAVYAGKPINECARIAEDRNQYRAMVSDVVSDMELR